jgi:hypothetical protein
MSGREDEAGKNRGLRGITRVIPTLRICRTVHVVDLASTTETCRLPGLSVPDIRRPVARFSRCRPGHLAQRQRPPQVANNIAVRAMNNAYRTGRQPAFRPVNTHSGDEDKTKQTSESNAQQTGTGGNPGDPRARPGTPSGTRTATCVQGMGE